MATTANIPPGAQAVDAASDPFMSTPSQDAPRHRYSSFNSDLFSLYMNGSPSQAKRALEAHLAETERRLQETSHLGTVLVQQRKELSDRLHDVEKQQEENELGPELRQRLVELEREFNEVGKDTARAFLPKSRVPSGESPEKGALGATVLTSDGSASPSKVSVPLSRKQRNQAPSRVHDIKLATEISSSLLQQLRDLQAVLAEKDDALKAVDMERSRLEIEVEGLNQRLRSLDESEQRYKDENWNLETRLQDLLAAHKENAEREKRANQGLASVRAEKTALERELEELRQSHAKLSDEHANAVKHHETELAGLRRNVAVSDSERGALQRTIDELSTQNQELARAVSYRLRADDHRAAGDEASDKDDLDLDQITPEHSPPPSPSKATPRHGQLEAETLKSSLHHAHRLIQNLKNNIHREKTEKIELKRMLQNARDELDQRNRESTGVDSASKKKKNGKEDVFKKPVRPDRLGAVRTSREEIVLDEPDWEDQEGPASPSKAKQPPQRPESSASTGNEAYQTATENSDAFETANERDGATTETDAFHTGAETLDGDSSDELTETESAARPNSAAAAARTQRPTLAMSKPGDRMSYASTASADDELDEMEIRTPVQAAQPRYRLKINRGGSRRLNRSPDAGTANDAPTSTQDSPASFMSRSPPGTAGPSLAAELGDFGDSDGESYEDSTPGHPSPFTPLASPPDLSKRKLDKSPLASMVRPAPEMVDCGVMTEPWEPEKRADASEPSRPSTARNLGFSSFSTQHTEPVEAAEAAPPSLTVSQLTSQDVSPVTPQRSPLRFSDVASQDVSPRDGARSRSPVIPGLVPVSLPPPSRDPSKERGRREEPEERVLSDVMVLGEVAPKAPERAPPTLSMSAMQTQHTEPQESKAAAKPPMAFSSFATQETEPKSIGRMAAALRKATDSLVIAEDSTSQPPSRSMEDASTETEGRMPLRPIAANYSSADRGVGNDDETLKPKPLKTRTADDGTQTLLSAEEIEKLMSRKNAPPPVIVPAPMPQPVSTPTRLASPRSPKEASPLRTRRPGSPASLRSRPGTPPPLPPDHKEVIAAAAQRTASITSGTMGPPLMPASAYKQPQARPRTPTIGAKAAAAASSPKDGTTPRPTHRRRSDARSEVSTPVTRRSSVSSFASELDQRFNIRPPMADPLDANMTDPRMIQAITQTMIGEWLWKYTRKAGSDTMSQTRHRRFFWVHPYTRTLYWSEHDPSTAGRAQLKAKSVAIEGVQVVTDDNPMPPGLHRKSLVVITPGRTVKFTATTAQRHETWFNALSYLLLRTSDRLEGDDDLTADDVHEFNPAFGPRSSSRATGRSRVSTASHTSRTLHGRTISPQGIQYPNLATRQSLAGTIAQRATTTTPTVGPNADEQRASSSHAILQQHQQHQQLQHASVSSRISGLFRPASVMLGSLSGSRRSRHSAASTGAGSSIYDASTVVHDSAEDLRAAMERREGEVGIGLENVRACCDGKHDVGSLSRTSRYSSIRHRGSTHIQHQHHHHSNRDSSGAAAASSGTTQPQRRSQSHSRHSSTGLDGVVQQQEVDVA